MPRNGKEKPSAKIVESPQQVGDPRVRFIDVGEEESGQRLDHFLMARLRGVPKSHIYRVLRSGEVRVDSRRVEGAHRIAPGERIRIPPLRLAERDEAVPAPHFRLPVLFEDEALIALDKPAGLAVHGGSGIAHGAIESLRSMRPQARYLELVHRLDRETSGVLLVAKKRSALVALHAMLRDHAIDKRYLAGVAGRFRNERQRVRLALEKRVTRTGEKRVSVSDEGASAETILRRVARGDEFSLLEAQLLTGRTHQIRVHLAHLGHPILGDDKYGDFDLNRRVRKLGLKRMFLHAASLSLAHPLSGEPLSLLSPLPADLARFRDRHLGEDPPP